MLALYAGLLMDTSTVVSSGSGESMGASAFGCMMVVSLLLTACVGPTPDLAEAERNGGETHRINLTQLREDLPEGGVHLFSHSGSYLPWNWRR